MSNVADFAFLPEFLAWCSRQVGVWKGFLGIQMTSRRPAHNIYIRIHILQWKLFSFCQQTPRMILARSAVSTVRLMETRPHAADQRCLRLCPKLRSPGDNGMQHAAHCACLAMVASETIYQEAFFDLHETVECCRPVLLICVSRPAPFPFRPSL